MTGSPRVDGAAVVGVFTINDGCDLTPVKSVGGARGDTPEMRLSHVAPIFLLLLGCGDGPSSQTVADAASGAPDAAPAGFQIVLDPFEVAPGEEVYWCYTLPLPITGEVDVARISSRFSLGAHHMLLSTIDGTFPVGNGACGAGDFGFGVDLLTGFSSNLRFLSGAQTPFSDDPRADLTLEPGMAFRLRPSSMLLVQLHWANTGDEPQTTSTVVDFYEAATPPTRLLESFFFYHGEILVPPHSQAEAAGRCMFPIDVEVVGMVSHMHARGVRFTARRADGAGALVYEEASWQDPVMQMFPSTGLVQIPAGEGFEYRCEYDNQTDATIVDGDSAGDEMCMFIGMYAGGERTIFGFPGVAGIPANPCTAVP